MTNFEKRVADLGIVIPEVVPPLASYVPAVLSGNYIYVSGQLPMVEGKLFASGLVPSVVSADQANQAARVCVINILAAVKDLVGDLDKIKRIVKINGFVAAEPDFGAHPAVINGASDLLKDIFGEAGVHARAAVGVASLPLNSPVEVDCIIELH